jgi:hypothetical protein
MAGMVDFKLCVCSTIQKAKLGKDQRLMLRFPQLLFTELHLENFPLLGISVQQSQQSSCLDLKFKISFLKARETLYRQKKPKVGRECPGGAGPVLWGAVLAYKVMSDQRLKRARPQPPVHHAVTPVLTSVLALSQAPTIKQQGRRPDCLHMTATGRMEADTGGGLSGKAVDTWERVQWGDERQAATLVSPPMGIEWVRTCHR